MTDSPKPASPGFAKRFKKRFKKVTRVKGYGSSKSTNKHIVLVPDNAGIVSLPQPSDEGLDRLFLSERIQTRASAGVPSYLVGPLNRGIPFDTDISNKEPPFPPELRAWSQAWFQTPDPNQTPDFMDIPAEGWDRHGLVVNEDRWESYLWTKDNWWDLPRDIGNGIPGTWSVDNPYLWSEMRCILELADRMFKSALEQPWYDVPCFPRLPDRI
jgi:hypothetical protein